MSSNLKNIDQKLPLILFLMIINLTQLHGQNSCAPSSSNDRIFVGSSTITTGMLKPGINTFSMGNGVIESLVPAFSSYNQSKLQIAQSFRNFASSISNGGYEMKDFSFHSVFANSTQVRFLFLWNEQISINVTISMSIQFLVTYDREEFLMGSFVIDPVEFLLKEMNQTEVNYSRILRFKDLTPSTSIPNQSSSLSINLFIVGLRYLGSGISTRLTNENYSINSTELTFTIQRNNSSLQGLFLLHISYILYDRSFLASSFKMFSSWEQLGSQDKIDYWMKGVKQINFKQFETGNVAMSEFYFYKINRLSCTQGCAGCVSVQNCQKIQGVVLNDSDCIVCVAGTIFNTQTQKCELQTSCTTNEIWNGSQCICRSGLVRVNSQCITCPPNTTYQSTTQKCLPICSVVEVYNPETQKCDCIAGFYKISGMCGKCATGFTYDSVTQSCIYRCALNQIYVNGTCKCADGYVVIYGSCSKCPSGTIYNSLLQNCVPSCSGNRKILNGKCVCNDGTYQIGIECGTCPQGSTYNNLSKSCSSSTTCKQSEVIINGSCLCLGPYISGICQPCPTSLVWNASILECILKCPANSAFSSALKACVCNDGFYVIGETCDVCPGGTVYDFATRSCQTGQTCTGANEVNYLGLCICNAGFFRIRGNCSTCPSGTLYNETIFDCQAVCGQNQIYNSISMLCECDSSKGFYRISNVCQQCAPGTTFNKVTLHCQSNCSGGQIFTNGRCSCPTGFNLIGSTCGLCDIGTIYNASTLKCDKVCPDPNGYYQNGRCFCYPPYVVVNTTICQQCPVNTTYDISTLSCKSVTPQNNSNLTCTSTGEIKKLNTSTGLYYCACDQTQKYYFIYDRCGTCQIFTKYNSDTKSCELDTALLAGSSVFYFESGNQMRVGTDNLTGNSSTCLAKDNKIFINNTCKCISTTFRYSLYCILCPSNSSPNSIQTFCECNSGFKLSLTDYTCKPTSPAPVQQSTIQCLTNEIWNTIECVCVEEFYRINGTCTKCPTFSAFNGSTCVCQFGYYAQSLNALQIPSSCLKCHESCATCAGSLNSQCLSCSNISSLLKNGQCINQNCSIGYFYLVYSSTVAKCQKCSAYCKSCTSAIQCTECIEGFNLYNHSLTPSLSVRVCSQICGDGKRFERNCDDGNSFSGDGCSKDCDVENGWTCVGGTTTSKDFCSLTTPSPKAIITVMNATIQMGAINQNIRLTYIPEFFLKTDCSLCSNLFKITVTQTKIVPDLIRVTYIPKSKYQFSIEFKFSDILVIPIFKFGVQINPEYKQYFTEWDIAQWYYVEVNSVLLSKKDPETYLRTNQIV